MVFGTSSLSVIGERERAADDERAALDSVGVGVVAAELVALTRAVHDVAENAEYGRMSAVALGPVDVQTPFAQTVISMSVRPLDSWFVGFWFIMAVGTIQNSQRRVVQHPARSFQLNAP